MTQWLSGLYYADSISFYSPTQLCGGGTTKSNSNEFTDFCPTLFSLVSEIDSISYLALLSWKQADNSGSDDFLKGHTQ